MNTPIIFDGKIATFDAFNGNTHHLWPAQDGQLAQSGMNPPDSSIIGAVTHFEPEKAVKYLDDCRITPKMLVRAYNACMLPGVESVMKLVISAPEFKAWYDRHPPLVNLPFPMPVAQTPTDLVAEGEALIQAVRAYVQKVQASQK